MRYPSPLLSNALQVPAVPVNISTSVGLLCHLIGLPGAVRIARDVPGDFNPGRRRGRAALPHGPPLARIFLVPETHLPGGTPSHEPLFRPFVALLTAVGGYWAGAHRSAAGPATGAPAGQAGQTAAAPAPAQNGSRGAIAPNPQPELQEQEKATIALFEHASPAVVFITSLAVQQNAFSLNETQIPRGSGSGFIWDREGHVVTNFHVLAGA